MRNPPQHSLVPEETIRGTVGGAGAGGQPGVLCELGYLAIEITDSGPGMDPVIQISPSMFPS